MIANTYILEDKGCIVAYYSLLNDKVSKRGIDLPYMLFCLLFAFMNTFLEVHFREQPYHQVDC